MIIYTYSDYGENICTYKYDGNGIRTSKTVNGVTTNYDIIGTTVLAQYDAENEILFQYNGSTPIGFVLNDVQYLYITNQSGDVRGITDAEGNLIAQYAYDEWGKLLSIETAEEDNAEQLSIAQINPLRYRGYYYDNETGLYYLQSRYYNPEWCRFISVDDFRYINSRNINAYTYCANDPVIYSDPNGCEFLSAAIATISSLFVYACILLVLVMIWPVIIALTGSVSVDLPTFTLPSITIPQATPQEKADAKIKDRIKYPDGSSYWIASRKNGYVTISTPLSYSAAVVRVCSGGDVFAVSQTAALNLAYSACVTGKPPIGPEIDRGKEYTIGYYRHYHPNPRTGAHIFFL